MIQYIKNPQNDKKAALVGKRKIKVKKDEEEKKT
jgi:hypothetical protein